MAQKFLDHPLNQLLYERFGSRRGFIRVLHHWFLAQVGFYRQFANAKPMEHQRLVFICSGNICRSPLAEVYARSLGKQVASCGLDCENGYPADPRAQKIAHQYGLNLDSHRTKNVRDFEFFNTDFIVLMEPSHIVSFQKQVGKNLQMVLAGSYCDKPNPYIHDPFNCCDGYFIRCENRVLEAVRKICD